MTHSQHCSTKFVVAQLLAGPHNNLKIVHKQFNLELKMKLEVQRCDCVSVFVAESVEFSLDADSPINTPVLPCTPDFYLSHCQQVKYFSLLGKLSRFTTNCSVMFYLWGFEKYFVLNR